MSKTVSAKILDVMSKVEYLKKDGKVSYGTTNYNYLSEEKITTEIRKAMIETGLIMYPVGMQIISEREFEVRNGKSSSATITAQYRIQDTETGEYIEVTALGEGADAGDKRIYKALTGAFKYAQRETFMIPTGDDPDKISSEELLDGGKKGNKQSGKSKEDEQEPKTITRLQQTTIFGLTKDTKLIKDVLLKHGYTKSTQIKESEFKAIKAEIEAEILKGTPMA